MDEGSTGPCSIDFAAGKIVRKPGLITAKLIAGRAGPHQAPVQSTHTGAISAAISASLSAPALAAPSR